MFAVWAASSAACLLFRRRGLSHPVEVPFESIHVGGPEAARVSAGRDGAVRPPLIPRNRPRAALAGAWTRSAGACEADARSLPPTVVTRPGGSISRGGSAPR